MILNIFPKAACDPEIVPKDDHECNLEKNEKESEIRNLMWLSEPSLEIVYVSVFKEASKTLYLFFSLTRQAKSLKFILYRKYCLNFTGLVDPLF